MPHPTRKFLTPFNLYTDQHGRNHDDLRSRNGQTVEVLERAPDCEGSEPESITRMYRIRFPDGIETTAFCDEIGDGGFVGDPRLERPDEGEVIFEK